MKQYIGTQGSTASHLSIELDVRGPQADESGEKGLIQVAVLLEGHVLDHGGQLVVVTNQDHTLQPAVAILLPLHATKQSLEMKRMYRNIYIVISKQVLTKECVALTAGVS